jgi:hypothetical protein
MLQLTPIEETGLAPYKVSGDPVIALLAQLNRFAGEEVSLGSGCRAKRFVGRAFPLKASAFDEWAATAVVAILVERYACGVGGDATREYRWALSGLDNPLGFVRNNLDQVTLILAQAADAAGLDAANVGITTVDSKLKPTPTWMLVTGIGVGLLGLGALAQAIAKRRRRSAA